MGVEVVLFDLGGVLLPFDRERRIRALADATGAAEAAVRALLDSDLPARLDRGHADETDVARAVSGLAGRPIPEPEATALWLSAFEAPNAALWDLVARLRSRVAVGAFSDNPGFVREVFPAGAAFDHLFLSCDLGEQKPSAAAFQAVAGRLGVAPHAILFIDDMAANVDAARAQGWDAALYTSNDRLTADLAERGLP